MYAAVAGDDHSVAFHCSGSETPTFLPMRRSDAREKQPSAHYGANLASQHQLIGDMILSKSLKQTEMAAVAGCSERAIRRIASNLRLFGKTKAQWNGAGRRRIIMPQMLDALCERLLENPGLHGDEMAVFLYDEFGILVSVQHQQGFGVCRMVSDILRNNLCSTMRFLVSQNRRVP